MNVTIAGRHHPARARRRSARTAAIARAATQRANRCTHPRRTCSIWTSVSALIRPGQAPMPSSVPSDQHRDGDDPTLVEPQDRWSHSEQDQLAEAGTRDRRSPGQAQRHRSPSRVHIMPRRRPVATATRWACAMLRTSLEDSVPRVMLDFDEPGRLTALRRCRDTRQRGRALVAPWTGPTGTSTADSATATAVSASNAGAARSVG